MKAIKQASGKKEGDKAVLKFMVAHDFDLEIAAGAVPVTPITKKKLPIAHLCVLLISQRSKSPASRAHRRRREVIAATAPIIKICSARHSIQ